MFLRRIDLCQQAILVDSFLLFIDVDIAPAIAITKLSIFGRFDLASVVDSQRLVLQRRS